MLSRVNRLDGGGEGFGIAFLEANAWEKPVVAGAAGGAVDAVADGVSGVLVTADDVHEVADVLVRLLMDAELCKRLGQQGRRRVEEQFSWPRISAEIENALLGTSRKHGTFARGRDGKR
jgi:phosphatidylinositol alpha-1,6-mannosyltransferase